MKSKKWMMKKRKQIRNKILKLKPMKDKYPTIPTREKDISQLEGMFHILNDALEIPKGKQRRIYT